jgi:hypothetical protein
MSAMSLIRESIIITQNAAGEPHIAPLGLIADSGGWIIAPFAPSRTLDNLRAHPYLTANVTDDVRVFAGCLTGRRDWPVMVAEKIPGSVLAGAVAHRELEVVRVTDDAQRPKFHCRVVHEVSHTPAPGFNRAQAAVIEAAVLVSRLHMLPQDKVRGEIEYLRIAISKTAGPREQEAWDWLMQRVDSHYSAGAA